MSTKKGIVRTTSYVMITLVVVKLIGFLKQAVIAAYFGTSTEMDLYLIASEFITEVGIVFFSSLSVSFLAMYVKVLENEGKREASVLFSNTLVFFVPVAIVIIVVIWIFITPISAMLASGYTVEQQRIVGDYIKFLSIVVINICISNICMAVLEGQKVFLPGKMVGIIQSVCIVMASLFFSERSGIKALLYAVLAYFVIQNIFLLYFVLKNVKFCVGEFWNDHRVVALLKISVPLFFGNAVIQINAIVNKSIASHLDEGSVAALSYSNYLFQTVHSIIIGSLCTVIFSYFSSYVAKNEIGKINSVLQKGVANILLLLLPLSLILIVNAEEIVRVVYARGAFDEKSVVLTTYSFVGYTIGIVFIAIRDLLVRAHYAFQDTKTPMINGALGVAINIVLSIVLARYVGVFGIAVADAVAYFVVLLLANHTVKRHIKEFKIFGDFKIPIQLIVASITSGFIGDFVKGWLLNIHYIGQAIISSLVILIIFLGMLLLMKNSVVFDLIKKVNNKLKAGKEN